MSRSAGGGQWHHALALVFSVFAIAAFFNAGQVPRSVEPEEYYSLACTALGFDLGATQTSIQAYVSRNIYYASDTSEIALQLHIAMYLFFTDNGLAKLDLAWMYVGHAVRLGQSVCYGFPSSIMIANLCLCRLGCVSYSESLDIRVSDTHKS